MQAKLLNEHSEKYLFARQMGSGEPLLILHGLLGSGDNWISAARGLADHHTVFSLDLRNHGRSFHSDHFDYAAMAGDVSKFMAQNALNKVSVIGHSMGGKTAMQLAYLYPERLKKLVVVDIAPKAYPPQNLDAVNALLNLDLTRVSRLSQADEQLKASIPDTSERMSHLKNLRRGPEGTYYWQINLEAIRRSYAFISDAVTNGTYIKDCLFIRGNESDYIQDADWDNVLKNFPLAQLVAIPGAGHWVHIQARQIFIRTVLDYLAL